MWITHIISGLNFLLDTTEVVQKLHYTTVRKNPSAETAKRVNNIVKQQ